MAETEPALDALPVRQGDIFEWTTPSDDPWRQQGIVLTADCDLAFNKHRGVMTYAPILALREYVALMLLPELVADAVDKAFKQLLQEVHRAQSEIAARFPTPMSLPVLRRWVETQPSSSIVADLEIADSQRASGLESKIEALLTAQRLAASGDHDEQVDAYLSINPQGPAKLYSRISAKLARLPSDALFLTALPDRDGGFIIYLRLLRELAEEVAVRADLTSRHARARRIARLTSPYRYRMTQQLADVFGAIGLPVDYEERRAELITASYGLQL